MFLLFLSNGFMPCILFTCCQTTTLEQKSQPEIKKKVRKMLLLLHPTLKLNRKKKKKKSHRDSSATARYLREKAGTSPHRRAEVQRVLSQPFPGAARRGPARPQPRRGGRGSGHGAALPPLRARVASALRAPPAALSSAPRLGFAPLPSPGERRRPPQPSRSRSRARGAALRPRLGAAPVPVPLNYRT